MLPFTKSLKGKDNLIITAEIINYINMTKELQLNGLILVFLVLAGIGSFWLIPNDVKAGLIFLLLLLLGLVLIGFLIFAYSEKDLGLKIPINRSLSRAILVYIFGLSIPIILFLSLSIFNSVKTNSFLSLFTLSMSSPISNIVFGSQATTFSALTIANDNYWSGFVVRRVASVVEELVLGFGFVFLFLAISKFFIRPALNINLSTQVNNTIDFFIAIIGSVLLFTALHLFNGSYTSIYDFAFAGLIRLLLNIFIYKFWNWGLEFSIGFHESINTASRIVTTGIEKFFIGLISNPFGAIEIIAYQ